MLTSFAVTNFKNFKDTTLFDLCHPANYEFNTEIIKDGCITKGIICGINGSGKSCLALALFDIVIHLTDKERILDKYEPYLNLYSKKTIAEFEYNFVFDGTRVMYRYGKTNAVSLTYEEVCIDGKEVLNYNFITHEGYSDLAGTENLQMSSKFLTESDRLSRVKYVKSNAMLEDTKENRAFLAFMEFVENMLMFYSLLGNRYQGFSVGSDVFTQGIIREGKTKEFEDFLRHHGIEYDLVEKEVFDGTKELFCRFPKQNVLFSKIASTGTISLTLLYYWYIKMKKASFVYIDEFDAFYHTELSRYVVELLKGLPNVQIFLSTHNTDLLSNDLLRPDAFFEIINNRIFSFDRIVGKELRKAHNIQKMYKAGAFNE